jgi:hypothetical protein
LAETCSSLLTGYYHAMDIVWFDVSFINYVLKMCFLHHKKTHSFYTVVTNWLMLCREILMFILKTIGNPEIQSVSIIPSIMYSWACSLKKRQKCGNIYVCMSISIHTHLMCIKCISIVQKNLTTTNILPNVRELNGSMKLLKK